MIKLLNTGDVILVATDEVVEMELERNNDKITGFRVTNSENGNRLFTRCSATVQSLNPAKEIQIYVGDDLITCPGNTAMILNVNTGSNFIELLPVNNETYSLCTDEGSFKFTHPSKYEEIALEVDTDMFCQLLDKRRAFISFGVNEYVRTPHMYGVKTFSVKSTSNYPVKLILCDSVYTLKPWDIQRYTLIRKADGTTGVRRMRPVYKGVLK